MMREWIDLFEKAHSLRTGMGIEVIAIENPNTAQMMNFLDRYHRLRGFIDDEGNVYIWNAIEMTHFTAEMQLGARNEIGFYLAERIDGQIGCQWGDYSGTDKTPEDFPKFNFMCRRASMIIGKTDGVFVE